MKSILPLLFMLTMFAASSCEVMKTPVPGAGMFDLYGKLTEGKSVAVVANQTSMIDNTHLVDTLVKTGVDLKVIFAPEHGFRDLSGAGENIQDGKDPVSGVPIISLYGSQNKPTPENLEGVDVVIFDIQDVGVRYYSYLSTLHYVMEACAGRGHKGIPTAVGTQRALRKRLYDFARIDFQCFRECFHGILKVIDLQDVGNPDLIFAITRG
jgi:uncharacterized protein YbbC (DUF1343 family)